MGLLTTFIISFIIGYLLGQIGYLLGQIVNTIKHERSLTKLEKANKEVVNYFYSEIDYYKDLVKDLQSKLKV